MRAATATAIVALGLVGCGSSAGSHPPTTTSAPVPLPTAHAHPQALEPTAGQGSQPAAGVTSSDPAPMPSSDPKPTGPASVTGSVASGAPTDAQIRAAIAKFKQAVARYHLDRLNLTYALLDPSQLPPGQYFVSIASVFTDYGLPIACGGVLHVPQLGVANKTLPCGTMVTFVYGNRAIRIPVIDRGPYIPGRMWDLTGAAAEALHFPGLGPIKWRIG